MHILAILISLLLQAAAPSAPEISWEKDWKAAFERARAQQKLVFVDYWASWCEPCREMDRRTFPDPRMRRQLQPFVLLKLDVDQVAGAYGVRDLPTYRVFDPWENERLQFRGFQQAEPFARKLALVGAAAPTFLRAARSLKERDSADGHLLLGHAYLETHAPTYAREEFERAGVLAKKEKNAALAQVAEIRIALAFQMEGKASTALGILEKILAQPANAECEAGAWVAVGHVRYSLGDDPGAADAYRRAISVSPANSPIRRDAEEALATVPEKRP